MTIDDLHSNMVSWDELANDYIGHTAEIAKLRAALEQVEWVSTGYSESCATECPWCSEMEWPNKRHADDCARQSALNGGAK